LSDTFGLELVPIKLGRRQKAEEQIDRYEIPYSNNELIIHSGKYKPYIQEFEFILKDYKLIPVINQWLSGRGNLQIDDNTDCYLIASVIEGWEYEKFTFNTYKFSVKFLVDPFYYFMESRSKIITKPGNYANRGNIYSEPYIKINGNGNVELIINSQICSFTDVQDFIEIDTELKIAYKDTINQGYRMNGDFPILNPGINSINWTGNVTSLEIKNRSREL
jgi:phage-related protein